MFNLFNRKKMTTVNHSVIRSFGYSVISPRLPHEDGCSDAGERHDEVGARQVVGRDLGEIPLSELQRERIWRKPLFAITADAEIRFLRREVAVVVGVRAEGDDDGIGRREVRREPKPHQRTSRGVQRDIDARLGVDELARWRSGQVAPGGECRGGDKKARNGGQVFSDVHRLTWRLVTPLSILPRNEN